MAQLPLDYKYYCGPEEVYFLKSCDCPLSAGNDGTNGLNGFCHSGWNMALAK